MKFDMTTGCLDLHEHQLSLPRLLWRQETPRDDSCAPSERCKHAATVAEDGSLFVCGGRSGRQPLKDLWHYLPWHRLWKRLKLDGCSELPPLEGHTIVMYGRQLFVFGGTFGYPDACETPLWIYSLEFQLCRQWFAHGEVAIPSSRRGHTAVVYRGAMYVFGGFVDLRGSVAELWCFDFATESWHLTWSPTTHSSCGPSPRHSHSMVVHDGALWVFGGMNDLAAKGDLWRWSFRIGQWSRIKFSRGPGALANHCATLVDNRMLVMGSNVSACSGPPSKVSLWAFSFDLFCWEDLSDLSSSPVTWAHICTGQSLHLLDFTAAEPSPPPSPPPPAFSAQLWPPAVSLTPGRHQHLCVLEDLELHPSFLQPPPSTASVEVNGSSNCRSVGADSEPNSRAYRRLISDDSQSEASEVVMTSPLLPNQVPEATRWAFRNPALSVSSIDSSGGDSGVDIRTFSSASSVRTSARSAVDMQPLAASSPTANNGRPRQGKKQSMLLLIGCCKRRPVNAPLAVWCADLVQQPPCGGHR